MAGMGAENTAAFSAALPGDVALRTVAEGLAPSFATVSPDEVAARLGNLVSDVDRAAISGEAATWLADVFRSRPNSGHVRAVVDPRIALPVGQSVGWGEPRFQCR
jgi:hypothetical protein